MAKLFEEEYAEWLWCLVETQAHEKDRIIFDKWNQIEYIPHTKFDQNRIEDAYELRDMFKDTGLYSSDLAPFNVRKDMGFVSITEMLVALSVKVEDVLMYEESKGDRTHIWFWMLVRSIEHSGGVDIFDKTGDLKLTNHAKNDDLWQQINLYFGEKEHESP